MSHRAFPIPVVAAENVELTTEEDVYEFLPLPPNVEKFTAPNPMVTGSADKGPVIELLHKSAKALELLIDKSSTKSVTHSVLDLNHGSQVLLAQLLGEGEVSSQISLPHGESIQIQESVYTGVWRVLQSDQSGRVISDHIEIASVPQSIPETAARAGSSEPVLPSEDGLDLMNARAIAQEIIEAQRLALACHGQNCHTVNFTLQPVTVSDMCYLNSLVGGGPVGIFSRGYGKCVVSSTGLRYVWRVRFFDGMNKTLLDTLEITRIPSCVQAAQEDLVDTRERIQQLCTWLEREDV